MTAQVRLYNDGPDDVEVVFIGKENKIVKTMKIAAGDGRVIATNAALNFHPIRKPTNAEMAAEYGMTVEEYEKRIGYTGPTRYADAD